MTKKLAFTFLAIITMGVSTGCEPSTEWNGKWDLDAAKSAIPGPTFVVSMTQEGMYRLETGSSAYDFACDGNKYSTTTPNRFVSCIQKNPLVIDSIWPCN